MRIKTTSLVIHEEMCPKVLDDVDEIVVELRLISNLLMVSVQVQAEIFVLVCMRVAVKRQPRDEK